MALVSVARGECGASAFNRRVHPPLERAKLYHVRKDDDLAGCVPQSHLDWMAGLPTTTRDKHRIFVHAGLLPGIPAHRQKDETCLWIRERFCWDDPTNSKRMSYTGIRRSGRASPMRPSLNCCSIAPTSTLGPSRPAC